jgi:hypothetical protein
MNAVPSDPQARRQRRDALPQHTDPPSSSARRGARTAPTGAVGTTSDPGRGPAPGRDPGDPDPGDHDGPPDPADGHGRLEVSGTQVAASVLASVSAAVVASFFGVAGTIVGAAVVSVVATVGSAAYGLGIRRTKHRLHQLQSLRMTRPFPLRRFDPVDDGHEEASGVAATAATADTGVGRAATAGGPAGADGSGGWRDWLARRRWGLAAGVAVVFVISLVSVTMIEVVGNRTLSGEANGSARTSLGALLPGGDGADDGGTGEGGYDTGEVDGDPGTSPTTVPGDTTTTSAPAGERTTSTTATPRGGAGDPVSPTTSSSTTTTAPPATTTTAPEAPAPTVPVPTTTPAVPSG